MSSLLRILLIRDSETETQKVLQALTNSGYQPMHQQVSSAVAMQVALQQPWDVIICDDWLPNFSAREALQILQAARLDCPLIVLSRLASEEIAVELMQAGARDCVAQNSLKRLVATIARELGRPTLKLPDATHLSTAIVESAADAIISIDLHGYVLTWNQKAEQLYGYSFVEAQGKLLVELVPSIGQPDESWRLLAPFLPDTIFTKLGCRQVTQQRKTGEPIDVLLTIASLKSQDLVVGFVVVARDLNEREMIRCMKDEFISIVNHELRTPLTSLQASIELLLTGKLGELSHQGLRMLTIAANNIDRLVQLVNNILNLEGLSSGAIPILKQPCDIGQLVHQSIDKAQTNAIQRGVKLSAVTHSIQVSLDPERVEQALHHLITNAIQFSKPGGQVSVEVAWQEHNPLTAIAQPHVLIKVADEGEGIPADKLNSIFEPFHQVDGSDTRRQDGAGLGLAICRSIAQHHRGNLWVESTIGQGSTFFLALPVQRVAVPV